MKILCNNLKPIHKNIQAEKMLKIIKLLFFYDNRAGLGEFTVKMSLFVAMMVKDKDNWS